MKTYIKLLSAGTAIITAVFGFVNISQAQFVENTGQNNWGAYGSSGYNSGYGYGNQVNPGNQSGFATTFPVPTYPALNPPQTTIAQTPCVSLGYNLRYGMRDYNYGDVTRYQNFLIIKGYLNSGLATGYFGRMTVIATMRFQSAYGISSTGYVGPLTRAKVQSLSCNTTPPPVVPPITNVQTPVITSITPSSGVFGTRITIYGQNFSPTSNSINFANVNNIAFNVPSTNGNSIQFTIPYGPCPQGSQVCPALAFAPGQFQLSVSTSAGTSNSVVFNATDNYTPNNQPPVISGVDGPVNLSVGQQGSWTVSAFTSMPSGYSGGALSYSVIWGDESQFNNSYYPYPNSANSNTQQSASFTHVYNNPGTYRPTFTVRASNGQTAQVSIAVQVIGSTNQTGAPVINSISPSSGPAGTLVTVYGSNFSRYDNYINFAGVNRAVSGIQSYDGRQLQFTIPGTPCAQGNYCAQVVLQPGVYPLSISNQYGTSGSLNFTVTNSNDSNSGVNQTITLSLNQLGYVNNQDLQITPRSIVEDSRCPIGVACFQAGKVVVQTHVKTSASTNTVNLASMGTDRYVTPDGYVIEIIEVTPAKYYGQSIWNSDYRITYKITR